MDRSIVFIGTLCILALGLFLIYPYVSVLNDPFSYNIFYFLLVMQDFSAAFICAGVLLIGVVFGGKLGKTGATICGALARNVSWTVFVSFAVLCVISVYVYKAHPLSLDEFMVVFQSRAFAEGKLTGQIPPSLINLTVPYPVNHFTSSFATGQVMEITWPGFALLMTPFTLIGMPWMLNPLLGALCLPLIAYIVKRLGGDEVLQGAAILFAFASPAFVVNAASFYSMNGHLFANLLFTALVLEPTPKRLFLAGVVGSFALIMHNPFPHAAYAACWIGWIAWRPGRIRNLTCLALGYLPVVLLGGVGWYLLRQEVRLSNEALVSTSYDLQGMARKFTLIPSVKTLVQRALALFKATVWAMPGLIVLAVLGIRRQWHDTRARLLSLALILTVGSTLFVVTRSGQGHGWGFRHLHYAWGALPILGALALGVRERRKEFLNIMVFLALLGGVVMNGYYLYHVEGFMSRHLAQLPEHDTSKRQVVWVRPWTGYYAIDLVQNDPFLRNKTLYFSSPGMAKEAEIVKILFPDAVPGADPEKRIWLLSPDKGGQSR